jgi:hypothetical protein
VGACVDAAPQVELGRPLVPWRVLPNRRLWVNWIVCWFVQALFAVWLLADVCARDLDGEWAIAWLRAAGTARQSKLTCGSSRKLMKRWTFGRWAVGDSQSSLLALAAERVVYWRIPLDLVNHLSIFCS